MSQNFAVVPWLLQDCAAKGCTPRVDGLAIAVYAALQRFTDFGRDTGAVVSDARLAHYAGCDTRTVQRRREVLREVGFIDWTPVPGRPNRYVVRTVPPDHAQNAAPDPRPTAGTVGQSVAGTTDTGSDDLEPTPRSTTYSAEFERCWRAYPKRSGGNSKRAAHRKWKATVRLTGASPATLLTAVKEYASQCDTEEITGTGFVKQASTFFGPDEHWRDYLEPTSTGRTEELDLREADW